MIGECLERVRKIKPLIHNITNYVTANDVANVLLACGASPIMADSPKEVEDITAICKGLNINIGTLNEQKKEAIMLAGRKANELGKPVVLDPVGAGSSLNRTETARWILENIEIDVVRGNISEIKALALGSISQSGVDANTLDEVTEKNIEDAVDFIRDFSLNHRCISVVTGNIDIVTDGDIAYTVYNGRKEMRSITGIGCQLSGLTCAYISANLENKLDAALAAVALIGFAGEKGWSYMQEGDGNAAYRSRIIDAVYNMNKEMLEEGAKYKIWQ